MYAPCNTWLCWWLRWYVVAVRWAYALWSFCVWYDIWALYTWALHGFLPSRSPCQQKPEYPWVDRPPAMVSPNVWCRFRWLRWSPISPTLQIGRQNRLGEIRYGIFFDSARYNAGRKTWVDLWNGSQGQIYRLSGKNDRSLGKMLPFVRKAEYKLEQEGEDDYLWTNIFI